MPKRLVLDANILVRAVLGRRVGDLLETYANEVQFFSPESAFAEVKAHLPAIRIKRGISSQAVEPVFNEVLDGLRRIVTAAPQDLYQTAEGEARRRLADRDEADWPVVALALVLDCPIWTEDQDFFGVGIATWTTDRVEGYFRLS